MKVSPILAIILAMIFLSLPACQMHKDQESQGEHQKIVVTSPKAKDIIVTQQYVCQIRSWRWIEVKSMQDGYLEAIHVKEGQETKPGEVIFKIVPTLYKAKYAAEVAEFNLAELEYKNTERLANDPAKVVSQNEVFLYGAKLEKARQKMNLSKAELDFATIKAPWDGIIDRLLMQQGSLIKKEDILTTLSDNSVMWVYFNVPEVRYLDFMAELGRQARMEALLADLNLRVKIELVLADGSKFPQTGKIGAIEGQFNNETGNIAFRADFPNPHRLLRHGQTGNVLIHRTSKNALVIPQRATFEILDKRYVYVVDKDEVVHQRAIIIQNELEDIFVIKKGLAVNDRIVLEGGRQVRDGEKLEEFEFRKPEEALANQKNPAE